MLESIDFDKDETLVGSILSVLAWRLRGPAAVGTSLGSMELQLTPRPHEYQSAKLAGHSRKCLAILIKAS